TTGRTAGPLRAAPPTTRRRKQWLATTSWWCVEIGRRLGERTSARPSLTTCGPGWLLRRWCRLDSSRTGGGETWGGALGWLRPRSWLPVGWLPTPLTV